MAEGQLGAVSKVDAGLLSAERMKEQVEWQQQAGLQAHKPATSGEFCKALPVLLCEAIVPDMLEVLSAEMWNSTMMESISARESLPSLMGWRPEGSRW